MFEIGLSTGGKVISEKLFERCNKSGIKHIEIRMSYDEYSTVEYKRLKKMAESQDINLWSFHLPHMPFDKLDISSSHKELRTHSVEYTGELIKKAADIGIDKYIVHSGGITKRESQDEVDERIKYACESYSILAELAFKCGGTVAVENLTPICVGKDINEVEKLLNADNRLRLCFDTNHLLTDDHAEFIRYFGEKIITLHISDCDLINERHWVPGEGNINWQEVLKALHDINYKGPWLYELLFKSETTLIRERDLTCEDLVCNAREIFDGKSTTIIPGQKTV